ncbi:MAG: hypothetical protein ACYC3E_00180 [Carboxydocellales bacterium]
MTRPIISTKLPAGIGFPGSRKKTGHKEQGLRPANPQVVDNPEVLANPPVVNNTRVVDNSQLANLQLEEKLQVAAITQVEATQAELKTGVAVKANQPAIILKDSYLSAKLRQQELEKQQPPNRQRKSSGNFGSINELMMENMWQEMEQQISFGVPSGKEIPKNFLDSMGVSGEQVMISPKAVAALREILGGK